MTELNYKELQEKGVFDVPYRAFEFMQSQQAKIDAITKQRDSFIKDHHISTNDVCEHKTKIDELQARVDEITDHVSINFDEDRYDDQHSYWSGYNQALREMNDILKGNKDE